MIPADRDRRAGEHVDEEADEVFGFDASAAGQRGANEDVAAGGVAVEEDLENGGEGHVARRAIFAGEGFHGAGDVGGEVPSVGCAEMRAHCGAGAVGGEFERRGKFAEGFEPVLSRVGKGISFDLVELPAGELAIGHGELGERGGFGFAGGVVVGGEFAEQDAKGPAVGDDVVEDEDEQVLFIGEAEELGAEERGFGEIEGLAAELRGDSSLFG